MTRKDYRAVADALINCINYGYVKKKDFIDAIEEMVKELSRGNSNFNKSTFREYIYSKIYNN